MDLVLQLPEAQWNKQLLCLLAENSKLSVLELSGVVHLNMNSSIRKLEKYVYALSSSALKH